MSLKSSVTQSQVFAKVTDSAVKRRAFLEYAKKLKKLVGSPTSTPRNLVWCPCKAPAYFEKLNKSLPASSPVKPIVRDVLKKIK